MLRLGLLRAEVMESRSQARRRSGRVNMLLYNASSSTTPIQTIFTAHDPSVIGGREGIHVLSVPPYLQRPQLRVHLRGKRRAKKPMDDATIYRS